jgi:uncharacterized membrane protein YbhN (UPF0104 family)
MLQDTGTKCEGVPPGRRRRLLRAALAATVLAVAVLLGWRFLSELHRLKTVPAWNVVGLASLYLASRATFGQVMRVMLARLGHRVSAVESFVAMTLMVYASLLVSHAAAGASAGYLYARRRVSPSAFGSTLLAMNALQMCCVGLAGIGSLLVLRGQGTEAPHGVLLVLFAAAALGGVCAAFVRFPLRGAWTGRVATFLRRVNVALDQIGRAPGTLAVAAAWQLLTLALRGLRLELAFASVAHPAPFPAALAASLLADLTVLVQVTPAGLGLREAAIGYAGAVTGVGAETAVAAALLDRVAWTGAVIVAAQLGLGWSGRRAVGPPATEQEA